MTPAADTQRDIRKSACHWAVAADSSRVSARRMAPTIFVISSMVRLPTSVRTLKLSGRRYLGSDTVGFIRKLPHQLIDAFGATLEETGRAELLVHVIDASAPEDEMEAMRRSVEETLREIGVDERPRVPVLNKVDLLDERAREDLRTNHPDAGLVSGETGYGLHELGERIERELAHTLRPVDLLVPYANGGSLAELHELAGEISRQDTPEGVRVRALVPARLAERFARFALEGR